MDADAVPARSSGTDDQLAGGELNAAVANAVVRYHADHIGRGPTRAQAFHHGTFLVVVLEEALTRAERKLAGAGHSEAVLELRRVFQEGMRIDLVPLIERLTGRTVRAFMSTNSIEPDVAAELFVLDAPVRGVVGWPAA